MVMGGAAGTLASSLCYPLDTIRRRMQMVGRVYDGQLDAFATIWREVRTLPVPLSPALTRTLNGADRDDIPRLSYAMSEPRAQIRVQVWLLDRHCDDHLPEAHSCAQGPDVPLSCACRRAFAGSTEAGP